VKKMSDLSVSVMLTEIRACRDVLTPLRASQSDARYNAPTGIGALDLTVNTMISPSMCCSMDKTDSINDRRVDVYLDSLERKAEWSESAEKAGMSLSKFVQACVQYALAQGGPDFLETGGSAEDLQKLQEELREKQTTIEEKDVMIEKLKTELKRYRTQPFLEDDFEGQRQFDTELIEILQNTESIRADELLRRLDVDHQNIDLVQAVQGQLEQLERYELVEETVHGWRWVG